MGRKCSVEGCLSDSNRSEDVGVTFHRIPMHSDVRPKWISLCRIPEKKSTKIIYICSRHFLRADFCNFNGKKFILRQGVLPSVFPWDKSKLQAMKTAVKQSKEVKSKKDDKSEVKTGLNSKTEMNETRSEPSNVSPAQQTQETTPINFTIDSRLEALDFNGKWFPVKIVEVDYQDNEVLIHFENLPSKNDGWISMNSSRLRALQSPVVDSSVVTCTVESVTD